MGQKAAVLFGFPRKSDLAAEALREEVNSRTARRDQAAGEPSTAREQTGSYIAPLK